MPLDMIYGQDASGAWGLFPVPADQLGGGWSLDFWHDGKPKDGDYATAESHHAPSSDVQPAVVPRDGQLDVVTWSQANPAADHDLTVEVNGTGVATVTVLGSTGLATLAAAVSAGDTVAVSFADADDSADEAEDLTVVLHGS